MPADTQTAEIPQQEAEKRTELWKKLKKSAADNVEKTDIDEARKIRAIENKAEWIAYLQHRLPEFAGPEAVITEEAYNQAENEILAQNQAEQTQEQSSAESNPANIVLGSLGALALGADITDTIAGEGSANLNNQSGKKKSAVGRVFNGVKKAGGAFFKYRDRDRRTRSWLKFGGEVLDGFRSGQGLKSFFRPGGGLLKREFLDKFNPIKRIKDRIDDIKWAYDRTKQGIDFINKVRNGSGWRDAWRDVFGKKTGQFGEGAKATDVTNAHIEADGTVTGESTVDMSGQAFVNAGPGSSAGDLVGSFGSGAGEGVTGASTALVPVSGTGVTAGSAGLATEAGLAVTVGDPYFWAIVGLVLAVIGIIALILIFIFVVVPYVNQQTALYNASPQAQYAQVQCADSNYKTASVQQLQNNQLVHDLNTNYGIILDGDLAKTNLPTIDSYTLQKEIYQAVCILFGHQDNQPNPPAKLALNTFGTLAVGPAEYRVNPDNPGLSPVGIHPLGVHFSADPDANAPCSVIQQGASNTDVIYGYNPEGIVWKFFPTNCNESQLQFLIAQSLTYTIFAQQHFLASRSPSTPKELLKQNMLDLFTKTFAPAEKLPSVNCLQGNSVYAKDANHTSQMDCFSDTVGTYLTYPFYDPTVSASQTTYATDASSTDTSTTTLNDFPTGKYQAYYNFAKTNLFDGLDFITALGNTSSIVNQAEVIADHLHSACWDGVHDGAGLWDFLDSDFPIPHYKLSISLPDLSGTYDVLSDNFRDGNPGNLDDWRKDDKESCATRPHSIYWCTYIVIDSYNLVAGGKQLIPESAGNVDGMVAFWKQQAADSKSGFVFLDITDATTDTDKTALLQQVKPGDALFYRVYDKSYTYEHTGLVSIVNIDQQTGDGTIHTIESNAWTDPDTNKPGNKLTVHNWRIVGTRGERLDGNGLGKDSVDFGGATISQ